MTPRPNFFIVGAPKCGTTALYTYLDAHPDVFMPEVKEPNHFGLSDHTGNPSRFGDEAAYRALFAGATTQRRIGEATPRYLRSAAAARDIHAFAPDAKIIIMLRDPVSLLQSTFWHYRSVGRETARSLADALQQEAARAAGHAAPPSGGLKPPVYRELPCFSAHVRRYFDQFGRENVHVILMDDLRHDTPTVYRQVCTFLGIDPTFAPDFRVVNPSKQVRSEALQRLLVRLNLTPLQLKNSRAAYLMGRVVPRPLRRAGVGLARRLYTAERRQPPIDPDLRRRLQADYRAEVEALAALLGRDLRHWYGEQD